MASYAVVSFEKEQEVDVTPVCWLTECEKYCYWPPYREYSKVIKAIKTMAPPQDNWKKYSVRVLATCGMYMHMNESVVSYCLCVVSIKFCTIQTHSQSITCMLWVTSTAHHFKCCCDFFNVISDDYAEARELAKKAENSSDIQSEGERGRGYRK